MKFVISWKLRPGGSGIDNEAAMRRSLAIFGKWTPPDGITIHQLLGRLDVQGGFAVVETDDPVALQDAPSKFGPFFDFEIVPVGDIPQTAKVNQENIEWRAGIEA